jgi:fatty acid desaturase
MMLKSIKKMLRGIFLLLVGIILIALGFAFADSIPFLLFLALAALAVFIGVVMVIDGYTDNDEKEESGNPINSCDQNSTYPPTIQQLLFEEISKDNT